jgi:hypothetical protein
MDVQATGEAFSPEKRTSKHPNLNLVQFLWVILDLLDPDPADQNQCGSATLEVMLYSSIL